MRLFRRPVGLVVLASLLAVPFAATAAMLTVRAAGAGVTDYTGGGLVQPLSIVTGPDGALWFTNEISIGRVTTAGVVTNFGNRGISDAEAITSGPDGALWFTDPGNNSIGRITTAGVVTHYTNSSVSDPSGITAGPDGALWFANNGINDHGTSIGRITTAGAITSYTAAGVSGPLEITVGPDGALWFTNQNNDSIGRITTAGVITNYTATGLSLPTGITTGPDGALWFTEYNAIGRITTAGVITIPYTFPKITFPVYDITTGPDGALWLSDYSGNSLERLTTAGVVTTFAGPEISNPRGITTGPDGALWFTNLGNGSIGRITVSTPATAVPDPPTITTALAGNGFAAVMFTPPANDGGSAITKYTTTCTSSNGGTTGSATASPAPVIVTALTNGSTYTCAITATNLIGTSLPSAPSNTFSPSAPATAPNAPTISLATPKKGAVTVNFAPGASSLGPILGVGVSCGPLDGIRGLYGFSSGTESPITVSGLTNESLYTCTAYEWNASGTSPLSAPSNKFVPSTVATIPTPPRQPVAVPGNGRATVEWRVPASNGDSIIRDYVIVPYLGNIAQAPQTLFSFTATHDVVSGLKNGRTYRFKVAAENAFGRSGSSAFTATVTVGTPAAPAAVRVARVANGALKVGFAVPGNNGAPISHYTATCTSANGGTARSNTGRAAPIVVTGLTAGRRYSCTVTATNSRGTGPQSSPSRA